MHINIQWKFFIAKEQTSLQFFPVGKFVKLRNLLQNLIAKFENYALHYQREHFKSTVNVQRISLNM